MKLFSKTMIVVAMMASAVAATGCSKADVDGAVAPEETAATAPVDGAQTASVEKDEQHFQYYARVAPPAARWEDRGRAPSARHFWAPGYWRWNGREHVWFGGRWEMRRDGYEYVSPHWQMDHAGRWEYLPGRWIVVRR